MQVYKIVQRFKQSGSVIDRRHGNTGWSVIGKHRAAGELCHWINVPEARILLGNLTNKACVYSI